MASVEHLVTFECAYIISSKLFTYVVKPQFVFFEGL